MNTIKLDSNTQPVYSVQPQDLLAEPLLLSAPRVEFNNVPVPCLGGIPLIAKLGQGGMAAVYYGFHTRLMLEVAVKVLPIHMAHDDPSLVQRFFREGQIAAKVKSPNLVSVLDVNEDKGIHYLVMEFVHGGTAGSYCRETIAKSGISGMDEAIVLDICIAATQGLAVAHAAGIVHRDIKPDNILLPLNKDGNGLAFSSAKLSDLGLARNDQSMRSLTGAQNVMGTPGYMAPEQATDSKNASLPSDIFSMGATAYSLLCGQPPFVGETTLEAVLNTIQKPHRSIGQMRPDLSIETASVIDRCLNKKPERRCPDGTALLKALQECRASVVVKDGRIPHVVKPEATIETATLPTGGLKALARPDPSATTTTEEHYVSSPPRRSGAKFLYLVLGMLLLAGGVWLFKTREDEIQRAKKIEDAAAEKELQQSKEQSAKEAREQAERMAALQREESEAQKQRLKAMHDAEAALAHSTTTATGTGTATVSPVETPKPVAPLNASDLDDRKAKVQQLLNIAKDADEAAKRATAEQGRSVDEVNKLSEKRRIASDAMQKTQSALRAASMEYNKTLEPLRRSPRNTALQEASAARMEDFKAAEKVATDAEEKFQAADKQYAAAEEVYTTTTAAAKRKLAARDKAVETYNAALAELNAWIKAHPGN